MIVTSPNCTVNLSYISGVMLYPAEGYGIVLQKNGSEIRVALDHARFIKESLEQKQSGQVAHTLERPPRHD